MVVDIQIVDTVEAVEQGRQGVDDVVCSILIRQCVNLLESVSPGVQRILVRVLAHRQGIAEVVGRIDR